MNPKLFVYSALITLTALPRAALAEVQAGPGVVTISVENKNKYNDNLFLEANSTKQDYINITCPSLAFTLPMGETNQHRIRVKYLGEGGAFARYKENNYYNQDVGGDVKIDMGRCYFKANERFRDNKILADSELKSPAQIKNNNAGGTIGLRLQPFTWEFSYKNHLKRYDHEINAVKEFDKNSYIGTGYYDVNKKCRLFSEYTYTDIDYQDDKTRKGYSHQFMGGLRAKPSRTISGSVKAGYVFSHYAANKGASAFLGGADITITPAARSRLDLSYEKNIIESTYEDINYRSYQLFSAEFKQRITEKLEIIPCLRYQNDRYPSNVTIGGITKKLVNDTVTCKIDLCYHITESLSLDAGYEYKTCLSNLDANEYKRNVYMLSARYQI